MVAAFALVSQSVAQPPKNRDASAKVVTVFNIRCAESDFPRRQLAGSIRNALKELKIAASHPTTDTKHAVGIDLNGDGRKEYFVMLKDIGIGDNVLWGIFAVNPARFLGTVFAENIYVRKRVDQWAALTTSEHLSVSNSLITTYGFRRGKYSRVAGGYEIGANRGDEPKFAGSTPRLCN